MTDGTIATDRTRLRRDWLLLSILVLGLVLRVGVIASLGDRALEYSSDSKAYQDIAVNLVERRRFVTDIDPPHTLDKPYANRPPVTPWLLASVYAVVGISLVYGQLLLALIGVGACFAVYHLGAIMFGRQVGLWACFLACVNPLWVLFSAVPMTESVAILLYPVLLLWSVRIRGKPTMLNASIMGLLFGVTALNKATILPFTPIWALWLLIVLAHRWKEAFLVVTVTAGACLAVILPWSVRNYLLFGRVIPITLQAGHSMYEANNPYTDYAMDRVESGRTWLNDPRYGAPLSGLSQLEVEDKGWQLALQYIKDNPGRFVSYAWRRLCVFWGSYDSIAHRLYWYLVGPIFAIGLALTWFNRYHEWRELSLPLCLIVQTMLLVILFPSMPRYRVPIEPVVLAFAATIFAAMAARLQTVAVRQRGS